MEQDKKPIATKEGAAAASRTASPEAMDHFFNQLQSDMRRPDISQDAVAAAFQEIQRMALEGDAEASATAAVVRTGAACTGCGAPNPAGNRFCSACGMPLEDATAEEGKAKAAPGQHHYHHHYHHHYFSGGANSFSPAKPEPRMPVAVDAGRQRSPLAATGMSRAEIAVRKLVQDWMQACNTKHLDDLVELYASDAIVLRPNVATVRGAAAIREFFFAALDAGLGEVELEPLRTELLGDTAFEAGRCKMLVPVAMGKRREERGKYLIILRRQPAGEWKVAADSWSSDLSLAASAEPATVKPIRKV